MGINYTSLQSTAARLLKGNGQAITFRYEAGESIDPATGVVTTPASESTVAGFGVALNYTNVELNGESIIESDLKLLVDNVATEPQVGWKATVNSETWRVMRVMPVNPAGTNIMYELQIRI